MGSDPPLILAFDTSAAHCAAALLRGEAVLGIRDVAMERGQAERLLPMLQDLLAEGQSGWSDVDALAVCTGPGNFTGLRLGVAAARGLAMALERPAIGVTVFDAFAAGQPGPALATYQDRRDGMFAQLFHDGKPAGVPLAGDPEQLGPFDPETVCVGARARELAIRLGLVAGLEANRADPVALGLAAEKRIGCAKPPVPLYLRPADAMPASEAPPVILDDADGLAALHALGFTDTPRPWAAAEFTALLGQPTTILATRPGGFALARIAGMEMELLTLVVHPDARRLGLASALVGAIEAEAGGRGVEDILLEVAVTNGPARALYERLGFESIGRRPRYYVRTAAPPVDALVMRKRLDRSGRGKTI